MIGLGKVDILLSLEHKDMKCINNELVNAFKDNTLIETYEEIISHQKKEWKTNWKKESMYVEKS